MGNYTGLKTLELKEKGVLFRFAGERGELRKITKREKQLGSFLKKLHSDAEAGDFKDFIEDEEQDLRDIVLIMRLVFDLMGHVVYDMHKLKNILKEIYKVDIEVKNMSFPRDQEQKLEAEVREDIIYCNRKLHDTADLFASLSRE